MTRKNALSKTANLLDYGESHNQDVLQTTKAKVKELHKFEIKTSL
jgi:hypothetical protein